MRVAAARAIIPVGLFLVVIASRLPFRTQMLWAWDSVLYARALEQGFHVDFDLADQRPQPPGYILYLAAGAVARTFLHDSNAALVAISIVASALGALAVFLVTRRFAGTGVSLFVAAAFAANPLVWTYGEIAYPYALLALLSVTLAGLFHWARWAAASRVLLTSFTFGLLAGFRQDILLFLGPLWLWMVWPREWRTRVGATALAGLGALIWLIPTMVLSDGPDAYLSALAQQSETVRASYSVPVQGLAALGYNLAFTFAALSWGLLAIAILLAGLGIGAILLRRRANATGRGFAAGFFSTWLAPGLLFYVVVHIGDWGYVLSVLPAFYVLGGALLARPVAALRGRIAPWGAFAAVIALAPGLLFITGSERFSAGTLAQHDRAVRARVAFVRERFHVDTTIILAREDFLTVRYYLPEYRTWLYDPEPYSDAVRHKRATRATAIVIFTEGLVPRQNLDVRQAEAAPGVLIRFVSIEPGSVLEFHRERFTVREPQ